MATKFKPAEPPQRKADVIVGDEVYFHHPKGGPMAGKVRSHGVHGCTVEASGQHHRVKWDRVLGHKKRAAQQYRIADEGEDGMIVEDATGLRQFLAVSPEAREEQMVIKSHGAAPRLALLIKSGMAPRPGLTEKKVTDKNGVQTTRWVNSTPDMPAPKVGHHVGFVNGQHRGHGRVASTGKDGSMVQDGAGGLHAVRHEHVTHRWDSEDLPEASPHDANAEAAQAKKDAGAKPQGSALFSPDEVQGLPASKDYRHKAFSSWDEVAEKAPEAHKEYHEALLKIGKSLGIQEPGIKPENMTPEQMESSQPFLFMGPLKKQDKSEAKVANDYGGDWGGLKDVVRASVGVRSYKDIKTLLDGLKSAGIKLAQQPKDNFAKPMSTGYRDLNMVVTLPNGMPAELQINLKSILHAKSEGHKLYNDNIALEQANGKDMTKWPKEAADRFNANNEKQKQLYGKAWEDAGGLGGESQGDNNMLHKSMGSHILLIVKRKGV